MLPTSLNEVAFTNASEAAHIGRIVAGEVRFPSDSKSCILLYGRYGTGKTTVAHMLPTLLENLEAESSERLDYDWQYKYRGNGVSVTPANHGKPAICPSSFTKIDCGSHHSNAALSIVQSIEQISKNNQGGYIRAGNLNHFLLDELDCWGEGAQAKLKGLITSSPPWNVFYITTNNVHKIDGGIVSRSIKLEMNGAPAQQYLPAVRRHFPHLVTYADTQLLQVLEATSGDWRQVEDLMHRL